MKLWSASKAFCRNAKPIVETMCTLTAIGTFQQFLLYGLILNNPWQLLIGCLELSWVVMIFVPYFLRHPQKKDEA